MFVGHYGVALGAKHASPRLSLGLLFLAVQFLDVLFAVFLFLGIEKMRIVHGFTAYNPYDLYWMPYTHSLVGALAWSALAGALFYWATARRLAPRERRVASLVLGAAVFSHFALDVPMHTPDLPLWPGPEAPKVGLGLWNNRYAAMVAELAVLAVGAWIYLRGTRPRSRVARIGTVAFFLVLVVTTLATPFQPDPAGPRAFAVFALVLYAVFAIGAALVDRGRRTIDPGAE